MKWDSNNLKPGMRLGENIYSLNSNTLLYCKGKELDVNDIIRIQNNRIKYVNIEYSDELCSYRDTFNSYVHDAIMKNNKDGIDDLFTYAKKASSLPAESADLDIDLTNLDFSDKTDDIDKIVIRTNMAICMARKYNARVNNRDKIDIEELFMASTLQDIGMQLNNPILFNKFSRTINIRSIKTAIPGLDESVLKTFKPEFVGFYSAKLLNSIGNKLSSVVKTSIFFKNEKTNGTGPLKVNMSKYKNNKSYMISNIMKTCELFYNALEANYSYTGDAFEGIEEYLDYTDDFKGIDPLAIALLKAAVPLYPVGSKVYLNDGTEGKVIKNNERFISKPIVLAESGEVIDLSKSNVDILSPYKNNITERFGYAM